MAKVASTSRTVIELQRLELKPESADEAIRLVRELWEILRRKQGCTVHRLYRSAAVRSRWLAYSEWQSLPLLGGARRELARSPLYRRMHSMLTESSERAYEPFGAALTTRGIGFGPETTALLIRFDEGPEEPERTLAFLKESAGYVSHITMRELGDPKVLVCFAHFDGAANAAAAAAAVAGREQFRNHPPAVETYAA